MRFSYTPLEDVDEEKQDLVLEKKLREEMNKHGALPTWTVVGSTGELWLVRGSPWKEDMNRYASPILRIAFDGPDIQEQSLYELCRVCSLSPTSLLT